MKTIILVTGTSPADDQVRTTLQTWAEGQDSVAFTCKSIHHDPALAIRLHISQLPALVFEGRVLAQGTPRRWLTAEFLDTLADQLR